MTSLGATLDCISIAEPCRRNPRAPRGTSQVEFTPGLCLFGFHSPVSSRGVLFPNPNVQLTEPLSPRPGTPRIQTRLPRILPQVPVRLPKQRNDHGPREHDSGIVLLSRQYLWTHRDPGGWLFCCCDVLVLCRKALAASSVTGSSVTRLSLLAGRDFSRLPHWFPFGMLFVHPSSGSSSFYFTA